MGVPEVVGIGAVATGAFALIWKMWGDHSALSKSVTAALIDNTRSNVELRDAVREMNKTLGTNTAAVTEMAKTVKANQDDFSRVLLEVLKK